MKFLSLTVVEISLTKNSERKKKEQTKGRTNRRMPFAIPRNNLSLWTCIPNMKFLSLTVVEISLKKTLNPTIQLVVVDLYTKYEVSVFNSCGDIVDEKFGKKEKGENKRTNIGKNK